MYLNFILFDFLIRRHASSKENSPNFVRNAELERNYLSSIPFSHFRLILHKWDEDPQSTYLVPVINELDGSNTYPITCGTSMEWEDARFRSPAISASLAKSVSWSASRALLRDSSNLTSSIRLVSLIVCKQDKLVRWKEKFPIYYYQFLNLRFFKFKYSIPSTEKGECLEVVEDRNCNWFQLTKLDNFHLNCYKF